MAQMTKMQRRIYDYIAQTVKEQGYPPSVREIGDAVGLKSPSTVHFHLTNMMENGFLFKGAGKGRALSLIDPSAPEQSDGTVVSMPTAHDRALLEEETPLEDKIPVVGNVAAGAPILAEENVEDYLTFDTNGRSGEYFALRVRGESMINAGILPGDLVVVHRQQTANNGEIVVALLEEEATVKRLQRRNGQVWLLPENEAYSPIDGTGAQLMGRVSAVVRRYS
jgi:repressor LexA